MAESVAAHLVTRAEITEASKERFLTRLGIWKAYARYVRGKGPVALYSKNLRCVMNRCILKAFNTQRPAILTYFISLYIF